MNLHPPQYQPIPVKAVIPRSLATRSQRINPWIPAEEPAATVCRTAADYELKEGEIKPTWQMYRVLTGQEKRRHFGLIRLDPERPSPTILGDTGCTTAGLVHLSLLKTSSALCQDVAGRLRTRNPSSPRRLSNRGCPAARGDRGARRDHAPCLRHRQTCARHFLGPESILRGRNPSGRTAHASSGSSALVSRRCDAGGDAAIADSAIPLEMMRLEGDIEGDSMSTPALDDESYAASFQNLGNATPQGFHCADVKDVLNGSCLRRLKDHIKKTGGKYVNPGYVPPPGW